MSFSTLSSTKFGSDIRIELVVCGYIRIIGIVKQIIPSSIINLCIKFYYSKSRIIFIKPPQHQQPLPTINVYEVDTNKSYHGNIKLLNQSSNNDNAINEYNVNLNCGVCYVKDFPLSHDVIESNENLNTKSLYDVIFAVQLNNCQFGGYIIDSTPHNDDENINVYYWRLPSSSLRALGQYLVYSN